MGYVFVQNFFPAMTKIVGTLGPNSRSVEVITGCLKAGMSGDFLNFKLLFIYCFFGGIYVFAYLVKFCLCLIFMGRTYFCSFLHLLLDFLEM